MTTAPEIIYAQRAAQRLRKLMDERGYPQDATGRCVALARHLHITESSAARLLSGTASWDWASVQMVSETFGKEPGYFLDTAPTEGLPSDTRIVTSTGGGESIAWRVPVGFYGSPVSSSSKLRYVLDNRLGMEGDSVSFLVFEQRVIGPGELKTDTLYMVESEDGYGLMNFVSIRKQIAVFSSPFEATEMQILMSSNDEPEEPASLPRVAGQLLGTITLPTS